MTRLLLEEAPMLCSTMVLAMILVAQMSLASRGHKAWATAIVAESIFDFQWKFERRGKILEKLPL